jgi:mono/diheme cytochrome c family protein
MKNFPPVITRLKTVIFALSTVLLYFFISGCNQGPPEGSRAAQAMKGKAHFDKYCSTCHGSDTKGLKIDSFALQPADLTIIQAKRRLNEFPILEIARIIDGRNMPKAHGIRNMPVWGEVFSTQEHLDEKQIKGKLGEIIAYLMTIQGS